MADKPTINSGKYFLTLVFASMLLVSFGMISHDAFAMGKAPGSCANEYDGPIVSAKINNGTQTFDALTSPTFQLSPKGTYYLLFIIHTPSQDSKGNSNLG
ncbi:MAG TPA: hypothetical protein VFV16_07605, partial [Candidatus Nitrosotalea sp.]|nr:hypothetical protein [Candidatus Nitrosotalea sp.]